MRPLVFILTPYSGDKANNIAYASECARDSISRGENPFVPHLHYPDFLDDLVFEERKKSIDLAKEMMKRCDLVASYDDLEISEGMSRLFSTASSFGINVERRRIMSEENDAQA